MLTSIYLDASARNVTPLCPQRNRLGVGFELESGEVLRLALTPEDAGTLAQVLADYVKSPAGSQSPTSPLMPSDPRSTPSEGVKV